MPMRPISCRSLAEFRRDRIKRFFKALNKYHGKSSETYESDEGKTNIRRFACFADRLLHIKFISQEADI